MLMRLFTSVLRRLLREVACHVALAVHERSSFLVHRGIEPLISTLSPLIKIDTNIIDLNESGTGILRYGGSPTKQSTSTTTNNNPMNQIDAKIDLLKRETEDAFNKFKGSNCC